MRRTASEALRSLEKRIARLERRSHTMSKKDRSRLDELQKLEDRDDLNPAQNKEYEALVEEYRKTDEYKSKRASLSKEEKLSVSGLAVQQAKRFIKTLEDKGFYMTSMGTDDSSYMMYAKSTMEGDDLNLLVARGHHTSVQSPKSEDLVNVYLQGVQHGGRKGPVFAYRLQHQGTGTTQLVIPSDRASQAIDLFLQKVGRKSKRASSDVEKYIGDGVRLTVYTDGRRNSMTLTEMPAKGQKTVREYEWHFAWPAQYVRRMVSIGSMMLVQNVMLEVNRLGGIAGLDFDEVVARIETAIEAHTDRGFDQVREMLEDEPSDKVEALITNMR